MAEQNTESMPEWAREILENSAPMPEWFRDMMRPTDYVMGQQLAANTAPQESETETSVRGLYEAQPSLQWFMNELPDELLETPVVNEVDMTYYNQNSALPSAVETITSQQQLPDIETRQEFEREATMRGWFMNEIPNEPLQTPEITRPEVNEDDIAYCNQNSVLPIVDETFTSQQLSEVEAAMRDWFEANPSLDWSMDELPDESIETSELSKPEINEVDDVYSDQNSSLQQGRSTDNVLAYPPPVNDVRNTTGEDQLSTASSLLRQLTEARPDLDWSDPEKVVNELLTSIPIAIRNLQSGGEANTSVGNSYQQTDVNTQSPANKKELKRLVDYSDTEDEEEDDSDAKPMGKRAKVDRRLGKGVRKCRGCKRHLRPGLFNLGSTRCHACVRKSQCMRRWRRYTSSVNNTFLERRMLAGEDAIDASVYLQSMRSEIRQTLEEGIELHTSFR